MRNLIGGNSTARAIATPGGVYDFVLQVLPRSSELEYSIRIGLKTHDVHHIHCQSYGWHKVTCCGDTASTSPPRQPFDPDHRLALVLGNRMTKQLESELTMMKDCNVKAVGGICENFVFVCQGGSRAFTAEWQMYIILQVHFHHRHQIEFSWLFPNVCITSTMTLYITSDHRLKVCACDR